MAWVSQTLGCIRDGQQDQNIVLYFPHNVKDTKTPCSLFHSLSSGQLLLTPSRLRPGGQGSQHSLGFVLTLVGKAFPQAQCVSSNDVEKNIISVCFTSLFRGSWSKNSFQERENFWIRKTWTQIPPPPFITRMILNFIYTVSFLCKMELIEPSYRVLRNVSGTRCSTEVMFNTVGLELSFHINRFRLSWTSTDVFQFS